MRLVLHCIFAGLAPPHGRHSQDHLLLKLEGVPSCRHMPDSACAAASSQRVGRDLCREHSEAVFSGAGGTVSVNAAVHGLDRTLERSFASVDEGCAAVEAVRGALALWPDLTLTRHACRFVASACRSSYRGANLANTAPPPAPAVWGLLLRVKSVAR